MNSNEMDKSTDFLSIEEFAKKINAHPNTVRRNIKCGRVSAFRIGPGKRSAYRIPKSEISRLAEINLMNVVDGLIEKRVLKMSIDEKDKTD